MLLAAAAVVFAGGLLALAAIFAALLAGHREAPHPHRRSR